ncbi:hypothetical protein M0802_001572 [Mischocyttarus mexicanus]|nr:hypothetical protein M0802_001572 [Mischocyttarus mexicanus]
MCFAGIGRVGGDIGGEGGVEGYSRRGVKICWKISIAITFPKYSARIDSGRRTNEYFCSPEASNFYAPYGT